MPARTGHEYLEGLRAQPREVWINGECARDVTRYPALRRGAASMAALYDMQHQPELRDEMTYVSPASGQRVGMSFLTPREHTDLARRRGMMKRWADATGGMMGRTPDYLNSSFMALAAAADYFAGGRPAFGDNVRRYYEHIREHDLCLTHTLINPQANRARGVDKQPDPYLPAGIVRESAEGVIIRGARMLATLGPLSDEIAVFPSTVLKAEGPDAARYAFAFAIPCATPGLKFVCRESFDLGRSHFDHPLGSRFEEMDAMALFDDVVVPWDRVFILGDVERCNNAYSATNAVLHMAHQVLVKNIAKAEFVLGLASMMVDAIAVDQFQHVQEKIAEIILAVETMRACVRASEADAMVDQWGVLCPSRPPLDVGRNTFPKMYPRLVEIIQQLGASGLMALPTEADLNGPLAPEIDKYFVAANADARERIRLFRLGWDVACSSFGARQALYERFFFGDPVRMMSALYSAYDRKPAIERVRAFLQGDDTEQPATKAAWQTTATEVTPEMSAPSSTMAPR